MTVARCLQEFCSLEPFTPDTYCVIHSDTSGARERRKSGYAEWRAAFPDDPEPWACRVEIDGLRCFIPCLPDSIKCPRHGGPETRAQWDQARQIIADAISGDALKPGYLDQSPPDKSLVSAPYIRRGPIKLDRAERAAAMKIALKLAEEQLRRRREDRKLERERQRRAAREIEEAAREQRRMERIRREAFERQRIRNANDSDPLRKLIFKDDVTTPLGLERCAARVVRLFASGELPQRRYEGLLRGLRLLSILHRYSDPSAASSKLPGGGRSSIGANGDHQNGNGHHPLVSNTRSGDNETAKPAAQDPENKRNSQPPRVSLNPAFGNGAIVTTPPFQQQANSPAERERRNSAVSLQGSAPT